MQKLSMIISHNLSICTRSFKKTREQSPETQHPSPTISQEIERPCVKKKKNAIADAQTDNSRQSVPKTRDIMRTTEAHKQPASGHTMCSNNIHTALIAADAGTTLQGQQSLIHRQFELDTEVAPVRTQVTEEVMENTARLLNKLELFFEDSARRVPCEDKERAHGALAGVQVFV
jgi:hypothetical protein